jgi:hypothetical protein
LKLTDLEAAVRAHAGEFLCENLDDAKQVKAVRFSHLVTPPGDSARAPAAGRLRDFYDTFGSVVFYHDAKSGDAARHIAPPSEWPSLHAEFSDWMEMVDEDERDEILPDWAETCLVIGETPQSGNYILMATEGPDAGHIFEFDHDGFEFIDEAADIVQYVERLLKPDDAQLTEIASHLRFVEGDSEDQWWIRELRDNRGHTATTLA